MNRLVIVSQAVAAAKSNYFGGRHMKNATLLSIAVLGCVLGCHKQVDYSEALQVFTNEMAEMERLVRHRNEGEAKDKARLEKYASEMKALMVKYREAETISDEKLAKDLAEREAGFADWLKARLDSLGDVDDPKAEEAVWKAERARRGVPKARLIDMEAGFVLHEAYFKRLAAESAARWDEQIAAQDKRLDVARRERAEAAKRAGR